MPTQTEQTIDLTAAGPRMREAKRFWSKVFNEQDFALIHRGNFAVGYTFNGQTQTLPNIKRWCKWLVCNFENPVVDILDDGTMADGDTVVLHWRLTSGDGCTVINGVNILNYSAEGGHCLSNIQYCDQPQLLIPDPKSACWKNAKGPSSDEARSE